MSLSAWRCGEINVVCWLKDRRPKTHFCLLLRPCYFKSVLARQLESLVHIQHSNNNNVKVKVALERATKGQRGSRGIVLMFP